MDFLNKSFAQASDLFRSMTPGARITAGLLLVVAVVSLAYLFVHQVSGPNVDLMNGMPIPASQIKNMESAFAKASLSNYEIRGTQIFVPRGQKAAYMGALADADALPHDFGSYMRKAVEEDNVFGSKDQRELRIKIALQSELAMIISSMPGIERASVLYNAKAGTGFPRTNEVVSGTVSVKPEGERQLEEGQARRIRRMVASAIGAKPEAIEIADLNGGLEGDDVDRLIGIDDPYVIRKRAYEKDWRSKIRDALDYVPGVKVAVNVELDRQSLERNRIIRHDPKTTTYRETEKTVTRSQQGSGPAGRPGYPANAPNTPTAIGSMSAGGSRQEEEQTQRELASAVSGEQTEKESVGLTPRLVRVSVSVPTSYFEKVWGESHPATDGKAPARPDAAALAQVRTEAMAKIQKHVAALLPPAEGVTDATQLVMVNDFQNITPPELPAPGAAENALAWLGDYWSTLGVIGLGLVSLLMVRSMVRGGGGGPSPGAEAPPTPRLATPEAEETEQEAREAAVARRLQRFAKGGPSLRDELSELVHEDPDAAANILRTWIGNAG